MSDQDPTHGADRSDDAAPLTRAPTTDPAASLDSLRTQAPPPSYPETRFTPDTSIPTRNPADTDATANPDATPAPGRDAPPDAFPGYEILETLGEGGMGVVYKARQVGLNRLVALKVVLGGRRAGPKDLIRFLAEAEAVASIRHPHVVQVHEYGEVDGRPFLAMEYLPGGSLADRIKHDGRLGPRDAAELVARLARAVQAAHDQGIVHRDLKPGNVLFDAHGEPRVTDFGLAKRAVGTDLTQTQAVMGTPAYMSPEQAQGKTKFVGPPADVYALGVVLYECLTGTRPFQDPDTHVLLRKVIEDDPDRPSRHVPGLPRDLELIALKCLAKDPADRYPTARALAEDLAHFVAGESVSVRAASTIERTLKWARRKPILAAAYALTAAVAVLLAFGASLAVLWWKAERARATAEVAKQNADSARTAAETAQEGEKKARSDVEIAREKVARVEYGRTMQVAHQEWRDNNRDAALALLEGTRADLRGWEWKYVRHLCRNLSELKGHPGPVTSVSWSPNGSRIATASGHTVRVWDSRSGAETFALRGHTGPVTSVSWSPHGSFIATASNDGTARVWDAETGREYLQLISAGPVRSVSLSPDSSFIATASGHRVRVWEASAPPQSVILNLHPGFVHSVSWSPDGSRIATASNDGTARVWDARTGAETLTLKSYTGPVTSASWSPDGSRIATASNDGTARVWGVRSDAGALASDGK